MIGVMHPEWLHLIALLPAVAGAAMLIWGRRRRQAAEALGEPALVGRLAPTLAGVPVARFVLVFVAALLLGVAAAGPVWGVEDAPVDRSGADVVLVLDASNSMLVEDVAPSRLEREREAALALSRQVGGARVGLIAFAGRAFVLSPLTTDPGALELYLDALSPDLVTQGGSSLSRAVEQGLALLLLRDDRDIPGALVLMTDGDALEDAEEIERATRRAVEAGVAVHTLGIGTLAGGPVPDLDASGRPAGFKVDPETGETAVSRLGQDALREVAERTGGTFRVLRGPRDVSALAAALRSGRSGDGRTEQGTAPGNRYEWFLGAALALLALDTLLAARRARRLSLEMGR